MEVFLAVVSAVAADSLPEHRNDHLSGWIIAQVVSVITGGDRLDNRGDNMNDRQDWGDNNREDRQDDRQDFIEDEIDDDWDRCRGDCGGVVAGVVVGAAIGAAATHDLHTVIYTLPCSTTAVMFNSVSYYNCSGVWYERVYSGGDVTYIVTTPPPGH